MRRIIDPARALVAETLALERTLSDLINTAYGLTPEEVNLLWATAPPRMPFCRSAKFIPQHTANSTSFQNPSLTNHHGNAR